MLQKKLTILKIICIILFCVSFGMAGLIILGLIKLYLSENYDSVLEPMPIITLIGFILLGLFQVRCYNLVSYKYPDKELTKRSESNYRLLYNLSSIIFFGICFCFIGFIYALLFDNIYGNESYIFFLMLITFAIYIPCHIHCIRQSNALRKIIKLNYIESQNEIVESIGEKNER